KSGWTEASKSLHGVFILDLSNTGDRIRLLVIFGGYFSKYFLKREEENRFFVLGIYFGEKKMKTRK
ncbi:MAG: hypothetical protein ACI8RA_001890, partial [Chlamydiales bacterium]